MTNLVSVASGSATKAAVHNNQRGHLGLQLPLFDL